MKLIKYQLIQEINIGAEDNPLVEQIFHTKEIRCSDSSFEVNFNIAQDEAYNGEVTVEDIPDEEAEPTQLDVIEAQVTYTAMMTNTLLEV